MRLAAFALLLTLLTACLPLPSVRSELDLAPPNYRIPPEAIMSEYVSLPGFREPHTPDRYNCAYYLRYYAPKLVNEPSVTSRPHTVLVMMPGLFAGATALDLLARQLVANREGLEVWVVDRRANALEDRSAMVQSLKERDPRIAYDYYVTNAGRADGFTPLSPADLRFTAFWGLEVHLRDLHEIVQRAESAADRVILGGHSLGASLVSFYSSYNFGTDDAPDPGYAHLDGLLLLEGILGRTGGFGWQQDDFSVRDIQLIASVPDLEAGRGDPYFLGDGFDPASAAKSEVVSLFARFAPNALSPGGFVDYPATNRAVAGILDDDQYGFSSVFSVSVGEVEGATLAGNIFAVLLDGAQGMRSSTVTGVAPGADFVGWQRGNREREVTDLDAYVRSKSALETNSSEWYFPLRLGLDMVKLGVTLKNTPGFVPTRTVPTPTLAVGAGRGLVKTFEDFSAYDVARGIGARFSAYIVDGFTHSDLIAAEKNPVVPLTEQWLEQIER